MIYKEPAKPAPCRGNCPAGIDIPRYIRLIRQGKYDEALAVIRERNPLTMICGRVCFHPCETACQTHHNHVGGPVAINMMERFVNDRASSPRQPAITRRSNKRVAVVGSGPAGLTAAYYLTRAGHKVTVFEALPAAGGMMRVGIPEYRLPREVLDKAIDDIKSIGFEIKTNAKVGSLDELGQGYEAVLLAMGAHRGIKLAVKGEDSPGVVDGVTLLRDVSLGKRVNLGEKVAVIGGGNVAMDSARTALRLGAREVTIIYRRTRDEMPAIREEVSAALYEGARIIFLAAPERIGTQNGRLSLSCVRMKLGRPDASGRPRPVRIKGSEFSMDFDCIVAAIGQTPDIPGQFNLGVKGGNTLSVDPDTLATGRRGVFAAGDMVTGPASVIEAIAAGRRAAVSIDKYLGGSGDIEQVSVPREEALPALVHGPSVGGRTAVPELPLKERLAGFAEVECGPDEAMALQEAARCLCCDLPITADTTKCAGCLRCALMCSTRFEGAANPANAKIRVVPPDRSAVPGESVISFADDCDSCGICVRACSYGSLDRKTGVKA